MTEWLANIKPIYVIAAAIVLFIARMILGRYKTPYAKSAAETVESALIAIVLVFLVIRPFIVQAFFIPSESMLPRLQVSDHLLVNKFIYRFKEPQRGDIIVFKSPPAATQGRGYLGTEEAKLDWNVVVGHVVGTSGSEPVIKFDPAYKSEIDDYKTLCLTSDNIGYLVLDVIDKNASGNDTAIKFAGISNDIDASALKGAEVRVGEKDYIKRLIGLPGDVLQVKNGSLYRNGERLAEPYLKDPNEIDYLYGPYKVPPGKLFMMGDNRNNSNDGHVWGPLDRNRVVGKAWVKFWPLNRIGLVK